MLDQSVQERAEELLKRYFFRIYSTGKLRKMEPSEWTGGTFHQNFLLEEVGMPT